MSATGAWVVGVIPDADARELPDRYVHLVQPGDWRKPPEFSGLLAWWLEAGTDEVFFERSAEGVGSLVATAAAFRFADLVDGANPDTAAAEALRDACMTLMPQELGSDGLFVVTARKANPVAALYYGLGARRAAMLPGWFGDYLLPADEVRAVLPRAEDALLLTAAERATVLARIADWMTVLGDAPDCDAAELIDAPLRVLRHAAEAGLGAAAFSRWY